MVAKTCTHVRSALLESTMFNIYPFQNYPQQSIELKVL